MTPGSNYRFYTGHSMAGTFKFGDTLIFEDSMLSEIKPGDVLIYKDLDQAGDGGEIVHRVLKVLPGGMLVQGDSNPCPDTTLVTERGLVGKVSHFERNGRRLPVRFSRFNLIRVHLLRSHYRLRRIIRGLACRMGHRFYGWLRNTGLIAQLWRPPVVKVRFCGENGPLVKYIYRNRTVANHWVNTGKFKCRKPYDLAIWPKRPQTKL